MKRVVLFEADDGSQFETEEDCRIYEASDTAKVSALEKLVEQKCGAEFCPDAGFEIYTSETIAYFIMDNYEKIAEIMGRTK